MASRESGLPACGRRQAFLEGNDNGYEIIERDWETLHEYREKLTSELHGS